MLIIKKIHLFLSFCIKRFARNINKYINYGILFLCICMFIIALFSNLAHKYPVLSYFAREMRLPNIYELRGVVIVKEGNELLDVPIVIKVGGYSTDTHTNKTYNVVFTSIETENIPVVVLFCYHEKDYEILEYINADSYIINKEFECHIEE